jgi:hypothetical protein
MSGTQANFPNNVSFTKRPNAVALRTRRGCGCISSVTGGSVCARCTREPESVGITHGRSLDAGSDLAWRRQAAIN